MRFEDPQWIELPEIRGPENYIEAFTSDLDPMNCRLAVVIIKNRELKPKVKKFLDEFGIPS